MADRHRQAPLSLRFPEAVRRWLQEESERTGLPVRQIVLRAVQARAEKSGENALRAMGAAAERERIRLLAIRVGAVCTSDEGTSCYFADLLAGEA